MLFQCRSSLARRRLLSSARISRLTIITMSLDGNRRWFLRKLSRNRRFSVFLCTALGICFRAIANPIRGYSPALRPTSMVIQSSLIRELFLKTCRNSSALVNRSHRGKLSPAPPVTLRRQARSAPGPPGTYDGATAAGTHARTKAVGSGPLEITGLKGTFHIGRLGFFGFG